MNPKKSKNPLLRGNGFAVIISLLLMSLLLLLSLSITSLIKVETERHNQADLRLKARQTARFALDIAIGQLQKTAGPDRRITACAGLLGNRVSRECSFWTGVWNAAEPESLPAWLVSGKAPDPSAPAKQSVILAQAYDENKDGRYDGLYDRPATVVPLEVIPNQPTIRFAWWVSDNGIKAAVQPVRKIPPAASDKDACPYLDYNENTLHAARIRQRLGGGIPSLRETTERTESAVSLSQLNYLQASLPEDLRKQFESEYAQSVCLENYFVLSNPLEGGLKKDLSYLKTLPAEQLEDASLQSLYTDPDRLIRAPAAHLIRHRAEPTALQPAALNQKMRLPASDADTAAKQFQYFSLAPVITELQLLMAFEAIPISLKNKQVRLLFVHKLCLEIWNPYTVPFLLGYPEATKHAGYSDLRIVIRNLPGFRIYEEKGSAQRLIADGLLPNINLVWSADSGIKRFHKLMRPGMVFRRTLPGNSASADVLTTSLCSFALNEALDYTAALTFKNQTPVIIEIYGMAPGQADRSFYKAEIKGYDDFSLNYSKATRELPDRLLFKDAPDHLRLAANPNTFALSLRMLDPQNKKNQSEHFSRLLSQYDVRRPHLKVDLKTFSPKDPWGSNPPIPYDFTTDGKSHQLKDYRDDQGFRSDDIFHYNEIRSAGGRKDRIARIFDYPVGEAVDIGIFRSLLFRDYPANVIGNPAESGDGILNRLYDRYFFSTLPDPSIRKWDGRQALANPRMHAWGKVPSLSNEATAQSLLIKNGFNLNASSSLAWEKILSGGSFAPGTLKIKYEKTEVKSTWETLRESLRRVQINFPQTTPFNQTEKATAPSYRFITRNNTENYGETFSSHCAPLATDRQHPALRQSIRELDSTEVTNLAAAIVASLRLFVAENGRPPFSLSEYLNAGILQQAIDATPSINQQVHGENGIPSHSAAAISQATLMNALGPCAFVRSDSFTIRAYAEISDPEDSSRRVTALCQAELQRIPEAITAPAQGRRFVILGFQWLPSLPCPI